MSTRRLFIAFVVAAGLAVAACQPIPVAGGGGTPCFIGTYNQVGEQVAALVNSSALGQVVSVTANSGGTGKLTVSGTAASGTWMLTGTQSFSVASTTAGGPINGTATIAGLSASGTYTATATTISLSLTPASLAGTFQFSGQPGNIGPVSITKVSQYLPVDELFGFDATANWSCTPSGPTFVFSVQDASGHLAHVEEDF